MVKMREEKLGKKIDVKETLKKATFLEFKLISLVLALKNRFLPQAVLWCLQCQC